MPSLPEVKQQVESRSNSVIVLLCMIITVIEGYNLIVYGSVVPLLVADTSMGVTEQQLGLIGGVVYIGAVVGALLAPLVADRTSKKAVLMIAIAVFAGGAILAGLSVNGPMLGIARFLSGVGVGGALTTAMTVARNNAASNKASLVVTITMAGIPLGGVVAALLAIPILPAFGWRPMFFIGAGMALAILVAVILTKVPTDTPQEVAGRAWTGKQKLTAVFKGHGAIVALLIACCAIANMVAWQGMNVWAAQAMVDLGFSLNVALLFTFALTGAAVLGSFVSAWVADHRGSALTAVGTGACTVLGLAGILLLPTSIPTVTICIALIGIGGHSTMNLVHTTTSDIYPLPSRASALGWSNSTSFIGAFLGPTLGGIAIASGGAHGLFTTFATSAGICLLALIGLYVADRKYDHASFHQPGDHGARHGEPLLPSDVPA